MRITSGTHKGRNIIAPKNLPVRPTTDFAKQALFNILANQFDFSEISVLDLFSGTGGISFEFASRGCNKIIAVDNDFGCCRFISETISKLGFKSIDVVKSDALKFLSNTTKKFDVIFADPPFSYEKHADIAEHVFKNNLLNEIGWLIIEHPLTIDFSSAEHFLQNRKYGNLIFSIFGNK
jgi:16S rRNA (guanine966-N2)-methyltransferase